MEKENIEREVAVVLLPLLGGWESWVASGEARPPIMSADSLERKWIITLSIHTGRGAA